MAESEDFKEIESDLRSYIRESQKELNQWRDLDFSPFITPLKLAVVMEGFANESIALPTQTTALDAEKNKPSKAQAQSTAMPAPVAGKPLQRSAAQNTAILSQIATLGYNPLCLP